LDYDTREVRAEGEITIELQKHFNDLPSLKCVMTIKGWKPELHDKRFWITLENKITGEVNTIIDIEGEAPSRYATRLAVNFQGNEWNDVDWEKVLK
jgi:hypothetical protein